MTLTDWSDLDFVERDYRKSNNTLQLRLDYTNLKRLSPFAKEYERIQNDCSIKKLAITRYRNWTGLGSDVHVYGQSMCKAMEMKYVRLRMVGSWTWNSIEHCSMVDERNNTIPNLQPCVTFQNLKLSVPMMTLEIK